MKNLFNEFPSTTKQQWLDKTTADLKGADFKKLIWNTYDGFPVQPFYTGEDFDAIQSFAEGVAAVQKKQSGWTAYVSISASSETAIAEKIDWAVRQEAAGVLIHVSNLERFDFAEALGHTNPADLHISFKLNAPSAQFVHDYFAYLQQNGVDLKNIHGFCDADVLSRWLTTGTTPDFVALAEQVKVTAQAPNFYGLVIHGDTFTNAGGNTTQEIAYVLNQLTECIDKLEAHGLSAETLLRETHIYSAVGGDYFFEIAKVRALRLLLHQVAKAYTKEPIYIPLFSVSAQWTKAIYDPNVNMLRNTTEAMAAVLGGSDAVLVMPHDGEYAAPTEFSERIALNISHLLQGEAYFDKVQDAAKGSYYIETLTKTLAEQALALFKEIEQAGGFVANAENNSIQRRIEEVRKKKLTDIATRKQVYVGVNQYVNTKEKNIITESNATSSQTLQLLLPMRATQAFEQLRKQTEEYKNSTGHLPSVHLVTFGNLAMRKARAAFTTNFFAAAGFAVSKENPYGDALTGVASAATGASDVVVLCASDEDYAAQAKTFAEAFRATGTSKVLVLAGYPPALADELKAAGFDLFIHVKSNVVDVLMTLQKKFMAEV